MKPRYDEQKISDTLTMEQFDALSDVVRLLVSEYFKREKENLYVELNKEVAKAKVHYAKIEERNIDHERHMLLVEEFMDNMNKILEAKL